MGRRARPHLPGTIFHLTARTLRTQRLFTPRLRTRALSAVAAVAPASGARVLAVAIMSNHLHLVVQQGERPLSALMQPLLRRLALSIQDAHDLVGPVFWRPYGSTPCLDPTHARNAIAYTHLNPVRAGLCDHPGDYRWTSHALFARASAGAAPSDLVPLTTILDPGIALPLFATDRARTREELTQDYTAFLQWRLEVDAAGVEGDRPSIAEQSAAVHPLGEEWAVRYSPLFHPPGRHGRGEEAHFRRTPDLASLARSVLSIEAPGMRVEAVRGRGGGREHSRLRHCIIRRLHFAGHRNVDIARFLGLSESAISWVLRRDPGGG